jgi:hypothetical protein
MKKIYLSMFALTSTFGLLAQKARPSIVENRSDIRIEKSKKPLKEENLNKITIWQSDFSNSSDWVIDHDAADCSLDFVIGINSCLGSFPIADINSTTASNGWALVDSDNYGGATGGTEVEDSWLTMTAPVDLSAYPNVVVEFETYYRAYSYEKPYLVVGIGDGAGNVTWPTDLIPDSDLSTYTGVYDVFPERAFDESTSGTENPRKVRINISDIAGGQQEVYIRFNWTGTYGYAWFIDDFKIIEQPLDDLESLNAYFAGTNNEGIEYGRTPIDQIDASYDLGGSALNFGINDQTNVQVAADFGSFNYNYVLGNILSGDTASYTSNETPVLVLGQYDGTFTVTSDIETSSGPEFYNNVSNRSFKITSDVYSQDGIGVNPTADQATSSLGSDSFGDPTDTYLASMFHLKKTVNQISGFEIGLSTASVAGGQLQISIVDTATFLGDLTTPMVDINGNQILSNYYDLAASEIAAGVVKVPFLDLIELPAGAYYAVVKPENTNNTPMRILDDETVAQPWYASMINSLNAQGAPTSYSNGNAFAIRLLMGDQLSVAENAVNKNFEVYPNPATASTTVSVEVANMSEVAISISDLAGKVIYKNNLGTVKGTQKVNVNTESLNSGVYLINVSINGTFSTQKLVVRK